MQNVFSFFYIKNKFHKYYHTNLKDNNLDKKTENLKTKREINPKHLTYNKLIGQRAKYNKNELLIISEKDATFTIICERPANYGNNGDESSNSGKLCGNNCCGLFGNSSSAYGGNSNKEMCYSIIGCVIFACMIVFLPLGILLFCLFYLCTKNDENLWRK